MGTLLTGACAAPAPDTILVNGKVFTANPSQPWAEALAISGERFVEVGDSEAIGRAAGNSTRRIDLGGRVVIPGLNDAHLTLAGATRASVRVLGADALAQGVTSIQVFSLDPVAETVAAFREAQLPLRVRVLRMPVPDGAGANRDSRPFFPPQPTTRLDVRGMGFALTGAEGDRMRQAVGWAYGSEDPLAVASLDAQAAEDYVTALERHGVPEVWQAKRPRVEQAVAMPAAWFARLPRLGAVAVQVPRAGAPLRSFLDAGVPLGLGSGDAFLGFAMIRLATAPALGGEALTVEQALVAATYGSAVSEFQEANKGRLVVGAVADLAVLDRDPFTAGDEEPGRIRSVLTMIGGRPVYDVPRP
ncbi:MAG: amidohydrolase family protein [Acidobacteriota bacterium]|nr:amidohydrolase family protein [Acidobacteriota bacterium]